MLTSEHVHLEPIHCHHADVIERIHASEVRLQQLENDLAEARHEVNRLVAWVREDSRRSSWFYDAEPDLRTLVESTRWANVTRRLIAWVIGAAAGFLMLWEAAEHWLKEHFHG